MPGVPGPIPGVPVNAFPGIVSVPPVFGFVNTAVCNCMAKEPECALVDLIIEGPPAQPSAVSNGAGGVIAQVSKPLFGIVCELAEMVTEANTAKRIEVFLIKKMCLIYLDVVCETPGSE